MDVFTPKRRKNYYVSILNKLVVVVVGDVEM